MLERILSTIFGIGLIFPLYLTFPFSVRILIKAKQCTSFLKKILFFLISLISLFFGLITAYFIILAFILPGILPYPKYIGTLGGIFAIIYIFLLFTIGIAIGKLGHGIGSPSKLVKELLNEYSKKGKVES